MFNRFRSFFALSRLPFRTHSHLLRNPNPNIYRVRFLRPAVTKNRLRSALFYTAGTVIYWNFTPSITLLDTEDGEEEDEDPLGHAVELGSENAQGSNETSLFIPLGLARQTPLKPYKHSDPEWKEFVGLLGNAERAARLRGDLAAFVFDIVMRSPGLTRTLGKKAVVSHWWFDIAVPSAPPPGYERGGLEITDDHIIWTTRSVTPQNYERLRHILWPSSMVLQRNKDRTDEQQSGMSSSSKFLSRFKKRKETSPVASEGTTQQANSPRDPPPINLVHSSTASPGPSRELGTVLSTFAGTLRHTWQLSRLTPSAGALLLTGLVQIHGQKVICTIDVVAAYNPKTNTIEGMQLTPRYMSNKRITPYGGPTMGHQS
ncbi:MAG: hypothetical protein M1812_003109 [Candelaria pacifica]|nr:MAG: hypothetical protein M1812_003109 [Candelaria pacifica]